MTWQGILGHDHIVGLFQQAMARKRLAGSYLFTGPTGVGKRTFALRLAKSLLCPSCDEAALQPCDACDACAQCDAMTHPDLLFVAKPEDKSFLPLDLLIGDKDHRMREGLCHDIAMKPYMGGRKVAIIDDADYLNAEGANCLLKTLEEPPPKSVLILIGTSPSKQLPTIRSRCQLIRFRSLATDDVAALLEREELVESPARARELAAMSEGSLDTALRLNDESIDTFRRHFLPGLTKRPIDSVRLAKAVATFVDEAGKDAPARRRRLLQVIGLATAYYRGVMRTADGAPADSEGERDVLQTAIAHGVQGMGSREAADRVEACLDAAAKVERNANLSTLIEHWANALR